MMCSRQASRQAALGLGSRGPCFFAYQFLARGGNERSGNPGVGWWHQPPAIQGAYACHSPNTSRPGLGGQHWTVRHTPQGDSDKGSMDHTLDEERQMLLRNLKTQVRRTRTPREKSPQGRSSRQLHMRGRGLSTRLGEGSELPRKLPASPPTGGSHGVWPILPALGAADVADPGVAESPARALQRRPLGTWRSAR